LKEYEANKLIARADANLYKAKASGRNCIVSSEIFEQRLRTPP
jgi:PleD family two-component response regulator